MSSLRDIKKRITSVKNTQKITKAMKMVAAAKLRRAQSAVLGSRPYSLKLKEVVMDIASKSKEKSANPLFVARKDVKKVAVFVFSSNRGLCGGFNSNLLRRVENDLKEKAAQEIEVHLTVIGRKGREFLTARGTEINEFKGEWAEEMTFKDCLELTAQLSEQYTQGEFDECYLCFNKFNSAISQDPMIEKLLPLEMEEQEETYEMDYLYEPSKEELLDTLLPKFVATQVYKAHLESLASELGARMTAMDNATGNAKDMINSLSLKYNRARQAAITTELMDIVNGAESLN